MRGLFRITIAWMLGAGLAFAQQPAPPDRVDAIIAPLIAKVGSADAPAALLRLSQLALTGDDPPLIRAAVEALPRFGRDGARALEHIARDGSTLAGRARALALLIERDRPSLRGLLIELATGDSPVEIRLQALDALADDPDVLPQLEPLLLSNERRVLVRALHVLGRARRPAALDRARELLSGDARAAPAVKVAAIEVLRGDGSPDSIRTLLQTSARELGEVRAFALQSLAVMDRGAVLLLLLPMLAPAASAEEALTAIELLRRCRLPATDEALRRALDHKDCDVQAAACLALGELGDAASLPRLEKATLSPDDSVASAAIEAVTRLRRRDPAWRERLQKMAHVNRGEIRLAAAEALGTLQDPTLLPLLVGLLDDRDWRVRETAAEGLGRLRQRDAIGPLIDHLERDRYRVRTAIAAALRRTTGMPFEESRSAWKRWWTDAGRDFTVPPLADVEAMEARLAKARAANTTRATFYGIPVTSDHVTVVIDVSGSMAEPAHAGEAPPPGSPGADTPVLSKLDVAKSECTQLLEQMPDGAHLNLLFFSDHVERWQHGVVELDRPRVLRATTFVRDRHAGGATNLCDALAQALGDPETDTIYLLSDGEPTAGKIVDPALLRADVRHQNHGRRVVIDTIALGHESPLLHHLAEDSGGLYVER